MEPRQAPRGKMSTKRLERLSEVIIDTLKTLSTHRQKLTPESLSDALKEQEEFWVLLAGNGKRISAAADTAGSPFLPPSPASAGSTEGDHGAGWKCTTEISADATALSDFYRKCVLALLALVQDAENKNLAASLEHMRSLVLSNSMDLQALGSSLQQIKNQVIKEGLDSSPPDTAGSGGSSSFWSFWQRRTKQQKDDAPSGNLFPEFQRLQQTFLAVINELRLGLDDEDLQQLTQLKSRFESSPNVDTLLALTDDLVGMVESTVQYGLQQREEMARFVKELGRGLLDMENLVITSLTDTERTYEINTAFDSSLYGQLEDIRESFSISKNLEEARGFVFGKLKAIRSALESKRKQEETYFRNAQQKIGDLQHNFEKMKKEIGQVQKKSRILEHEILLDSLTGIYNRRAYEMRIKEELSRFQRYGQPFSLILFDIDYFKKINDQFGHQAGDRCLREIAARIKPFLRHSDFLARYGGEEFIIILPGTVEDDACKAAEKIRILIEKTRFLYEGAEVPVTISIGLTQASPTDEEPAAIFQRADTAMYQAKNGGRNQTRRA